MENGYRNKAQKVDINENKEILLTVSMKWVINNKCVLKKKKYENFF